tara:strand:- start:369 stop:539 length:171 start_codon:yes stop_codon:yes gene_type:complete
MSKHLTKEQVFAILYEETEKIQSAPIPMWGYTLNNVVQIINSIREKVDKLEESTDD